MYSKSRCYPIIPVILLVLAIVLFQPGCKNYNEVELYPPCDTTSITYSGDIMPIFSVNCNSCHNIISKEGNVILDELDSARISARNGQLLKAVTHDPSVVPMPKGGGKLSDCDISKIKRWINTGEPAR